MKRLRILALGFISILILFSLAMAQEGMSAEKTQLTQSAYREKMADLSDKISHIAHSQLRYAGKEVQFISKKVDPLGNVAATGFYDGQKIALEDIKKEYLSINPPSEYIETHKLFGKQLDYYIAAYGKAVEAHVKDDVSIMDTEGGDFLHKASQLALQLADELQRMK